MTISHANSMICKTYTVENEFSKLRKSRIDFLDFEENELEGMVYDFKINGLKVQEKSHDFMKKYKGDKYRVYNFVLNKSDKVQGKNSRQPYEKGDNDFYWLNLPDKQHFYLIPEGVLIDLGYISNGVEKGIETIGLYPYENIEKLSYDRIRTAKLNYYLFDYLQPEKDKILALLNQNEKYQLGLFGYDALRSLSCSNIKFEYYKKHFLMNSYKVIEKNANFMINKTTYQIALCKNTITPFQKDDYNFYWINLPDHNRFYLIPESALIRAGFIATNMQKGRRNLFLRPDTNSSLFHLYLYQFNDPNLDVKLATFLT